MSVSDATKTEMKVDDALRGASAEQLRRAMRTKLVTASHYDDMQGQFINPDDDSRVEDIESLKNAQDYWRRGDKREAPHHLELALGRDFIGLGELRVEDLR